MVQWVTRSTRSGRVTNSGEHERTVPMGLVLGSSSGKLHGLSRKLSEGSDRAEVGEKGFGHGGRPRAALAGRGEVAGAAGELGKARRGAEGATGKAAVHEGGLYSHSRAWHGRGHRGDQGRAGVRVRACSVAFPSVCPRRTHGGLLLPVFNGLFGRLSVQISAKIPCTVSSLHQILSFPCEFQAKIWSGLRVGMKTNGKFPVPTHSVFPFCPDYFRISGKIRKRYENGMGPTENGCENS
jgi:hypothetical protein